MEASTSSEVDFQIPANSRIPLPLPSGDEVESAISRFTSSLQSDTGSEVGSLPLISSVDGLGKLQSVEGMTIRNAFELDRAKPIQNLLKDVEMWNAFVNNKEVKECLRQQETEAIRSNNSQTQGICCSQQQSSAMEVSTSSEVDFQIPANSRIPLFVPSGDEVESAISGFTSFLQSDAGSEVGSLRLISSLEGLGKLQSVEGMTIQNAFELMDRAKPIQNLLKAVATNVEMWNAFLNNKEVQEFLRQLETEAVRSNNSQTQAICYSQQQSSGANNVVTSLSSNQQTDNNLSSQQWSSGANNVVRTPSINPQTHNGFFSQQQSSAQQESSMPNLWAKIFLTLIGLGKPIFMAFKFYWNYRGGGGGDDGCGRGGLGGGGGGGGPSAFYNYFVDKAVELKKEYPKVVFVLDIMLMLSILLMRFYGIRC